jgi:CRISPR-associated exonuclease Cas4
MVVALPVNMQYNVNKYVRASEVASYYLCPRLTFFGRRRVPELADAEIRAGVFKSISLGLGPVVSSSQPGAALEEAIRLACSDAILVYGPAHEQAILLAGQEARGSADDMLAGLLKEKERLGEQDLARWLSPASISLTVYSERLRMSGTVDKVVFNGNALVPVIISASLPPPAGIFASDRVRLAAYAMLLAERADAEPRAGAVEYVRGWCLRHAEVRHEDKRKALYARNRVLEFNDGAMPDAVRGKWCGRCGHYDTCNVKVTLLDSLFKKRA